MRAKKRGIQIKLKESETTFQKRLLRSDLKTKNYLAKIDVQVGTPRRGHCIGKGRERSVVQLGL